MYAHIHTLLRHVPSLPLCQFIGLVRKNPEESREEREEKEGEIFFPHPVDSLREYFIQSA